MTKIKTSSPSAGTAHLGFTHNGSRTVLARSFSSSPVKVFETRGTHLACWAHVATLGGGLVGGDEIQMTIDVATRSRALLMTQASTKVYRSLRRAKQEMSAMVGSGGLLAVLPDPVVCFAGADFLQSQRYDLYGDASLVITDWITSGRHAAGERWAFSRYESRIVVTRDERPVFWDTVILERDLESVLERMGRFDVLLTAMLSGPLVSAGSDVIRTSVAQMAAAEDGQLIVSASKLGDGSTLLRMAGVSVEQVGRTLRDWLTFLYPLLGDNPWRRKW